MNRPLTPECDKLHNVYDESNKLGLFLDWILRTQGTLCEWSDTKYFDSDTGDLLEEYEQDCIIEEEGYFPSRKSIEKILAEYFDIDMVKVEEERTALLEYIRENN